MILQRFLVLEDGINRAILRRNNVSGSLTLIKTEMPKRAEGIIIPGCEVEKDVDLQIEVRYPRFSDDDVSFNEWVEQTISYSA